MDDTLSISEVSELLGMTEKTVRNYIKRGFFNPEKWNGMWRISKLEALDVYRKKNGNIELPNKASMVAEFDVSRDEYMEQMIGLGKLQAYETLLREQKAELLKAGERIIQLEASSASGWTEARSAQNRSEVLSKDVADMRKRQVEMSEELAWVRRENERVVLQLEEQLDLNGKMRLKIRLLEDQLHALSLTV